MEGENWVLEWIDGTGPVGWDVYTAMKNGYTVDDFNSWPFVGYDNFGDEVRTPPKGE